MKTWKTSRADQTFSLHVRERDGRCLKCYSTNDLTCSHYWRRGHSATRFDLDNCITLCVWCHSEWENKKNNEYRDFMIQRLGKSKYEELEKRARSFKNRGEAVEEWRLYLSSLQTTH